MGRMADEAIRIEDERLRDDVAYREWSDGLHRDVEEDYYAGLAAAQPEHETVPETLKRLYPGEAWLRARIRNRRLHRATSPLSLASCANGMLADVAHAHEDVRIAASWPEEPMAEYAEPESQARRAHA